MRQSFAMAVADIADPRSFPEAASGPFAAQLEEAAASLASSGVAIAAECDARLTAALARALRDGEGGWLAGLLAAAPSAAIARHLWRRLLEAWDEASVGAYEGVGLMLFAIPVVVVAGQLAGEQKIDARLQEGERLAAILLEHEALGGNKSFGLAAALTNAEAIDVARLPELLAWTRLSETRYVEALRTVVPAAVALRPGEPVVHLRFLLGAAVAAPGADLLAEPHIERWGMPFARELARELAAPGATVLALPRAPRQPLLALQEGRAAQREVSAQLFASNALRRLRASVGEPAAVISAHRCPAAPGGGELRLSLSSAFDSRQAEGFRCPVFTNERVGDVAAMLVNLLRDCRVPEVRVLPTVYPDCDASSGLTLLFKAESLPASPAALQ